MKEHRFLASATNASSKPATVGEQRTATIRFANGYEMAGYYAARMLLQPGPALAQLGFLSSDPVLTDEVISSLHKLNSIGDIRDILADNPTSATASTLVMLQPGQNPRHRSLLVSIFDYIDGLTVDISVPYRQGFRRRTSLGQQEIIDLSGVPLEQQRPARLGCMTDFILGWDRYPSRAVNQLGASGSR